MSNQTDRSPASSPGELEAENTVVLRGRVSEAPDERELPSGDLLVTFRLVVPRAPAPGDPSRATSDWVGCAVWGGRVKRSVRTWRAGDVVSVTGALRRRYFRTASGTATRLEVEVHSGRVVSRAAKPA